MAIPSGQGWLGFWPDHFSQTKLPHAYLEYMWSCKELVSQAVLENGCPSSYKFYWQKATLRHDYSHFGLLDFLYCDEACFAYGSAAGQHIFVWMQLQQKISRRSPLLAVDLGK